MDCGKLFKEINCTISLGQAQILFDDGVNLSNNDQYQEALARLMQCLSIRREVLYKFHDEITTTLDFIAKVYARTGLY